MDGLVWLSDNRARVLKLAVLACRGRFDKIEMLWDVAVDRVPRMVEVLWDGERDLWLYVRSNLRWYFFKAMNAAYVHSNVPLTMDPADEFDFVSRHAGEEWVQYIIGRLSPEDAELIRLKVFEGLTFEAISFKLGLLKPTVYKRYQAALARVRELAGLDD